MTVALHTEDDYAYTDDGALMVSESRMDSFVAEWHDELGWLADR